MNCAACLANSCDLSWVVGNTVVTTEQAIHSFSMHLVQKLSIIRKKTYSKCFLSKAFKNSSPDLIYLLSELCVKMVLATTLLEKGHCRALTLSSFADSQG
jgi:hypothetical protein